MKKVKWIRSGDNTLKEHYFFDKESGLHFEIRNVLFWTLNIRDGNILYQGRFHYLKDAKHIAEQIFNEEIKPTKYLAKFTPNGMILPKERTA